MSARTILGPEAEQGHLNSPEADPRPPIVVLAGATGTGKSAAALALSEPFPVEVINADSRNFYRGMDIGTAKPTQAERAIVPHHLVDILEPDEPMSVSHFQDLATDLIAEIQARHRLPVVVGGSVQYVNALVEGWQVPAVAPNEPRRRELEREAEVNGVEPILARLRELDPIAAETTGPNLRRIIRALEVVEATGKPFSVQRTRRAVPFRALECELWIPRDLLYERIDRRVDTLIANGLVEEVRGLLARGFAPTLPAFSSIGYRQLVPAIVEGSDLGEAIERIKVDTHRLVRHQQTWYRRNPRLVRNDMTEPDALERIFSLVGDFLDAKSHRSNRSAV